MRRVRFAPSPTGSLHVGNALTAAANRAFGEWLLLQDLEEAREHARQILEPEPVQLPAEARPTLERFKQLLDGDARETVRELKAAGGDLHALRLALIGRERGPELWTVIHALRREEALRRVDAAL